MTHRWFAVAGTLAVVSVLWSPAAAQRRGDLRTPWGAPDLAGIWTNATLTPLQRPADLAGKEFFTPEEAAAYEAQRISQSNVDERPLREGDTGAYNDTFFERGSHIVESLRTSLVIDPPDGHIPPFTTDAQRKVDARGAWMARHPADGPEDRWLTERCVLFGAVVPMLPEPYNNHYLIVQTPDTVTVLTEMNHDLRIIYLDDRPHLSESIQQWVGDARGRWEGDTLVVESRNFKFNEQSRFGVGFLNGMTDENLRVIERFTRTDIDTLTYRATIEDPTVFTRPWTIEISMDATRGPLYEVACHEGNYGMSNILSGHRAEERDALTAR